LEPTSEEVLLRSCDGTDDLKVSPPKEVPSAQPLVITNCMHDYTFKDSNNPSNKNGDCDDSKMAGAKATLLTKRLAEAPTDPASLVPALVKVTTDLTIPVSTVSLGGGSIQIRSAGQVPPGTKMVPVKLITVPGAAGNIRMLRVSPVKTGVSGVTSIGSTGLPPRTIVLKSSGVGVVKVVTTSGQLLAGGSLGTASLVRYPAPSCDSAAPALLSSLVPGGVSLLKKSHSVNLTPVQAGLPTALDSSVPTKAAPVTFEKRASVEERRSREEQEQSAAPLSLSVDVSHRLSDSEQMPSPACRAAPQPAKLNGVEPVDGGLFPGDDSTNGSSEPDSLLRPLLVAAEEEPELPPGLPSLGPRKRSRRNTGSSAASDRSDLSGVSEPGAKRKKGLAKLAEREESPAAESGASPRVERDVSPQEDEPEDGEDVDDGEEDDLEEEEESNSESETDERPAENNGVDKNG
jgi:hypothetical protein